MKPVRAMSLLSKVTPFVTVGVPVVMVVVTAVIALTALSELVAVSIKAAASQPAKGRMGEWGNFFTVKLAAESCGVSFETVGWIVSKLKL